jgi:hypothetical protein
LESFKHWVDVDTADRTAALGQLGPRTRRRSSIEPIVAISQSMEYGGGCMSIPRCFQPSICGQIMQSTINYRFADLANEEGEDRSRSSN